MESLANTVEVMIQEQEEFYETQVIKNKQMRAASPIIFLLCFQNYIKSLLINEITIDTPGLSVLDLCCGKGGDIPGKWLKAKPAHYVGVDLSAMSVAEARQRYQDSVVNGRRQANETFPAIFIVADCGDQNNQLTDILAKDLSLKRLR
jgi:2-polyprenyl-3-methyl-5-hydroxy-6-metoxy-1,4-benzoquinol methylase